MSDELFVLLNGVLTFGLPLAWAVHQMMSLQRSRDEDDGRGRIVPAPAPAPSGDIVPAALKPLPDCLIPKLPAQVSEERELEPA